MIVAAGFTSAAFAQAEATATASATATIVAPITITRTVDMNFGNVAVHETIDGTVVLAPAGTRTRTGGVTLPFIAGTVTAASFNVTGSGTYTYAITLPTTDVTLSGPTESMILNNFTSTPAGTGALTAGAQTLNVGATLNVTGGQEVGSYTNANAVPVIVVYN